MKKRLLSLLLALALALTVLPQTALTAEPECAHAHTAPLSQSFTSSMSDFCSMLWLMAGSPEPTIDNPYTDVQPSDPYYKAALWGLESKVRPGGTETTFNPTLKLSRSDAVTALWRFAGCPAPKSKECGYQDVLPEYDYYKAVLWASETEWIDLGVDKKNFGGSSASGEVRLEGTVCEDCGKIVEGMKVFFVDPVTAEGTVGDNLEWKIIYHTMTITGSGEMPDFSEENLPPWYRYRSEIYHLSLPDGLTNVGDLAFKGCMLRSDLTIPDSVVSIGTDAFRFCAYATSLTLPDGLQYIGDGAFVGLDEIQSLTIPGSVIHIGDGAFASCDILKSVTISEGVLSLGDEVFLNDLNLKTANIPESVVHVGRNPFAATGLYRYSANWESKIMYLDGWALGTETNLREAPIRAGTRGIADCAFWADENTYLNRVTLPDSLQYIGYSAFAGIDMDGVKMPSHLQCIYEGAFLGCTNLKEVKLPESLEYIGVGAFCSCPDLNSVKLPSSITEIEPWTFSYDEMLGSMELPAGVERIGEAAFYRAGLWSITIANRACVIEEGEEMTAYMLGEPEKTTVYGYTGSTAEAYAGKYGYRFAPLSEKVPFIDVPAAAFYEDPVAWAVENEITKGLDESHFGPDNACTRGHVVTFLWRAAGEPEPKSAQTPFTDLKPGAFYEKAVAWAVEEGITKGLSDTTFGPDATCTRGQIVTFLWRFKDEPAPKSTQTPFTDVNPNGYYMNAVAWAVEEGVTKGLTETTFGPEATCSRGQVVTFLYRAAAE